MRAAAASALAEGLELYPEAVVEALAGTLALYDHPGSAQASLAARAGAAAALKALAPSLTADQLPQTLDFLLSRGLADGSAAIRDGMIAAGVAVVNAHGQENPEAMLPLFDAYLDKKVRRHRSSPLSLDCTLRQREGCRLFSPGNECSILPSFSLPACQTRRRRSSHAAALPACWELIAGGALEHTFLSLEHTPPCTPSSLSHLTHVCLPTAWLPLAAGRAGRSV